MATLVVFFIWTFPANQATANWTVVPENWKALRRQWEYAHATNAVLTLFALIAVTLSVVSAGDSPQRKGRKRDHASVDPA